MDSLVKAVMSLPTTTPVPAEVVRARFTGELNPIEAAVNPAAALVMFRFCPVPVCSVIAPVALIVGVTPVIVPILLSNVPTVSLTLSWLPVAPEATKVNVVPSMVIWSPATKFVVRESLPAAPDNIVALVIAAPALLLTAAPVTVLSRNDVDPIGSGLLEKSAGLRPPVAVIVPVAAEVLAGVFGCVGRLAAYWTAVVACAGMKLFWNCRTAGTLPVGLPVLGSTVTPI